jgi:ABC-type Na+ efflux pump permease subunit
MNLHPRRIRAMLLKELRDYRRNVYVVVTMAFFPLVFLIQPLVLITILPPESAATISHAPVLIYMLAIPVLTPATIAAFSVVGERQQGTLEPVLTTPIRREELLIGKALAALIPSVVVSYAMYVFFILWVELIARPGIAGALIQGPQLLAQVLFTPLLAACSIWVGMAISTLTTDTRSAQSLAFLATIPLAAVPALIAFEVLPATLGLALGFAVLLLLVDGLGWRVISTIFDRERLVVGTR